MKKEEKSVGTAIAVPPAKSLVLEGDPEQQLEFAQKAAKALMLRVNSKKKQVIINGKQYLEFGDWQTLARFFGSTVGIEWTKPIEGKQSGYEARAIVYQHGQIISSAEASCLRSERNWATRDEFALKSMAQTRAAAKALRNGFGWVAELAGYASTPAEEMDGVSEGKEIYDTSPVKEDAVPVVSVDDEESIGSQKSKIVYLAEKLGADRFNKGSIERVVSDATELSLTPENYGKIIKGLEASVKS